MQELLKVIVVGYVLFFIWNFNILIFLLSESINATIGYQLYATKPRKCVKLSGMCYGYVVKRGVHRVVLEAPSLYGIVTLNITPFTRIVGIKNMSYGEQVMVYGKLRVILGEVTLVPTKIICSNDLKKIKINMLRKLTWCMWISVMMEVIYYVIFLRV